MGYIEQTDIGNVYITDINDWFATLSNLNSECKNYIDSEIRYKEILAELKKQIRAEVIDRIDNLRQQYVDACNMCTSIKCEDCKINQFITDLEKLEEQNK